MRPDKPSRPPVPFASPTHGDLEFVSSPPENAPNEPPRRPDWLLVLIVGLLLLTLFIAWLTDMPILHPDNGSR